eukprot:10647713-Alexandrium_andersonii.AAC.1
MAALAQVIEVANSTGPGGPDRTAGRPAAKQPCQLPLPAWASAQRCTRASCLAAPPTWPKQHPANLSWATAPGSTG